MKTLTIPATHIGKVRDRQAEELGEICALLGYTPEHYCWDQYRQYESFVAMACENKYELMRPILTSPLYRGFWNNEWSARNQQKFLPAAYECKFDVPEMRAEYRYIHDAKQLYTDENFYNRFENVVRMICK
ncbi:hypothetical protein ACFS5N_16445 [Mucilaginibacter ximonensis]|uniref:Uncharacterized protein n=1 Tax=Mucilaginibacter ximonensis TaxID=538021 RepID=A0ABW5YFQ4_9SPHI